MSRVGDQLPPPRSGGGSGDIKSDNKTYIPDATRLAEIVEVWVYSVDDKGAFTRDNTGKKKARVKFQFVTRRDIVLDKRFPFYLGEKSHWSIFLEAVTGIPATKDYTDNPSPQRNIDIDNDVLGKQVLITTKFSDPYTDIISVMRPPSENDDFDSAPSHQPPPMVPAQLDRAEIKERLKRALRANIPKGFIDRAVQSVTGSSSPKSITTPDLALRVIAAIQTEEQEFEDEIPF